MKNYQIPELTVIKTDNMGDIITYSYQTEGFGDVVYWDIPNDVIKK